MPKMINLKDCIRDVPNFPKEGIIFKDITTLLKDPEAFRHAIDELAKGFLDKKIDQVVGVEARGFIFGGALAYKLGAGFIPVRKKGKLPSKTKRISYDLEYGTDTLEIHEDAIKQGMRVLIVDDVLATGGTIKAVTELVEAQGAEIVNIAFLVELEFLKGKNKLKGRDIVSVIRY